ncbi:MAG: PucR family transcriptional regulator [Actinomycetales bacterium]
MADVGHGRRARAPTVNALSGELQQLVDACAADVGRSVAIDDVNMRLLAVSAHYGDEDPARLRALVARGLDQETVDYLLQACSAHRAAHDGEPFWVQGRTDLELATRLFIPILCNDLALGYLCLIGEADTLPAPAIERAAQAADVAGVTLYRKLVLREWESRREESLLRDLISSDPVARASAAREIDEESLLSTAQPLALLQALAPPPVDEADLLAFRTTTEPLLRTDKPGTLMAMFAGRRLVVLADASTIDRTAGRLGALKMTAVGISSPYSGLENASRAAEEAGVALRAAELLPDLGGVARWQDLGVYALLMQLPAEQLSQNLWTPAVRRLAGHADLLDTAETYLDCAGDSGRAAERLRIHRSTFYYRLSRIEKLTGLHLQHGSDRLLLHLALKARRIVALPDHILGADEHL